jgi:branched-chain amino acid transport system substrate-binding protein
MKRSIRLRVPAIAVVATAALAVAACSSSSSPSTSSSPTSGTGAGASSSPSSSAALTASAPGITPTTITVGSHQPLTGPAAPGYSEIAPASNAYFSYVNAHGGVFGRKIVYKYLDDGYNPTTTSSVVHQLVLQDNVYAIFDGLGTPTHLAVESFLNAQKIPDVFVASGCDCWNSPTTAPDTFGWQLDYIREGKILGQYVAKHFAGKKVAYFYQDDEFGMDGVKGLDMEIPKSMVVSRQTYVPTNVNIGPAVAALHASGAQVVISFSIPAFTALLKLNSLKLGFSPALVVSNVGSDPITLSGLLESFAKQGGATVNGNQLTTGIITDGYLPTLGATGNSWISLFKKVHDQYDAKAPFDGNVLYGEAVAYTFVQAMLKAGQNPTRADLVSAINAGLPQGPAIAPYAYSSTDHAGVTGAYIGTIKNGVLVQQGPVYTTDPTSSGKVTTMTGTQQPAPASGMPAP